MWFHWFDERQTHSLNLAHVVSVVFPQYTHADPPFQVTVGTLTAAAVRVWLTPAKADELKALVGAPTWAPKNG